MRIVADVQQGAAIELRDEWNGRAWADEIFQHSFLPTPLAHDDER